jgi:hypothetical protein
MCDVPSQVKDALLRFDDLRAHYGRIYALATRSSSVTPARLALVVSPLATNAIAWSISATSTRYTHHPRSLPILEGREVHRRHQGVRMSHDRCRVNDVSADLVVAALERIGTFCKHPFFTAQAKAHNSVHRRTPSAHCPGDGVRGFAGSQRHGARGGRASFSSTLRAPTMSQEPYAPSLTGGLGGGYGGARGRDN